MHKNFLYLLSFLVPIALGLFTWVNKGQNFVLKGNIRIAQYTSKNGIVVYPFNINEIERWVKDKFLKKKTDNFSSLVSFAKRNPDRAPYTLYVEIIGNDKNDIENHFNKIFEELSFETKNIITGVINDKNAQFKYLLSIAEKMENYSPNFPDNLEEGEQFMNVARELVDIKQKIEVIRIALDPSNSFNTKITKQPTIKKKSSDPVFAITVWGGVFFLIAFLIFVSQKVSSLHQ